MLSGVRVHLAHPREDRFARGKAVLVIWALDDDLERVEQLAPSAICAIAWAGVAGLRWAQAWQPRDLRTGVAIEGTSTISNPVVAAAVRSLTARVNLRTGIAQVTDKAAAVQAFQILHAGGERLNGGEIQAWATANGWRADHARQLGELASRIASGATLRSRGSSVWVDDVLAVWRHAAESTGDVAGRSG